MPLRRLRYLVFLLVTIAVGAGLGYVTAGLFAMPPASVAGWLRAVVEERAAAPLPPVLVAEDDDEQAAQPAIPASAVEPTAPVAAETPAATAHGSGPSAEHSALQVTTHIGDPAADIPTEPLPKLPPEQRTSRVPVLMYHELGDVENGLYVRVADFQAQLAYLAENGYHPVTLDDLYRHFTTGRPLPPKPVVITFDDGYRSFWEVAVPLLQEYRYPATVFVITGLTGKPNYLTWEQVRALPEMGFEVGAHTVSHPDLRRVTGARLIQEVAGAKEVLEQEIGQAIQFFCYPSGRYDDEALQAVRDAGYAAAVTTRPGPATLDQDPLLWSRVRVDRRDTLAMFARKLAEASE